MRPLFSPIPFSTNPFLFILLILIANFSVNMDLNIEGLTIEDDGLTINLDVDVPVAPILENCLIDRVLSDKQIRAKYLEECMKQHWRPGRGLDVIHVEQNKFLLQFGHKADAYNVITEGLWTYDNANLVIQKISPGEVAKDVLLNNMEISIQVHGLPCGYVSEKIGAGCGAFLGELREYDSKNWVHSKYMRIRVEININQPLKRDMKLRTNNGKCVTVYFKYEKLGTFCFRCGVLGHTYKSCPMIYDEEADNGVRLWSNELKSSYKGSSIVKVNKWLKDSKTMMKEAQDTQCWNKMCLTIIPKSFDDNKVLKIDNWYC